MIIEFLGAAREVTGSCHYVTFGDVHLLVDCGMEQGPDLYENQEVPVHASEIDYVLVTHAHIDHSGLLPLLYKNGFRGWVYTTKATADLCGIMLRDSAHIQESEAEWKNRKALRSGQPEVTPMYDQTDVEGVLGQFVACEYDTVMEICEGLSIRFVDAGHLLGSASIEVWIKEDDVSRKLVFSGDIGNGNRPMIRNPEYLEDADYVVMESTYGNRNHEAMSASEEGTCLHVSDERRMSIMSEAHDMPPDYDYAVELAKVISATLSKGGNLVIPAFSVGRTQEMLYYIRRIKTEGLLPEHPGFEVYMDSPLAVEATTIYNQNRKACYNEKDLELINQNINPIQFPGLKLAVTTEESKNINFIDKPKVIISASGMCEAGRIRHHLKHNLWRADSTILFVGYQVPGTLGHQLLNGAKTVRLFGETIEVHADIVKLPGISAHADRDHLTKWAEAFTKKPQKYFIVHGEEAVAVEFAKHLEQELGVPALAPYTGDVYDLVTGEQIEAGERRRVAKKVTKSAKTSTVYGRLVAAGERLIAIIRKYQGGANKDLAKFADQITALCNKWDK